jgi:hypothetical protein
MIGSMGLGWGKGGIRWVGSLDGVGLGSIVRGCGTEAYVLLLWHSKLIASILLSQGELRWCVLFCILALWYAEI